MHEVGREIVGGAASEVDSDAGHAANPSLPFLGMYFVLAAPVIAGAIYGPLVTKFAPEARGHGVPEVMYAVAVRGGAAHSQRMSPAGCRPASSVRPGGRR